MYWICIGFVLDLYWICIGFVLDLYCICIAFVLTHLARRGLLFWSTAGLVVSLTAITDCVFAFLYLRLCVFLHFLLFLFVYVCISALSWATAGGDVWSPSLSSMFVCTSHLDPPANGEVIFLAGLLKGFYF